MPFLLSLYFLNSGPEPSLKGRDIFKHFSSLYNFMLFYVSERLFINISEETGSSSIRNKNLKLSPNNTGWVYRHFKIFKRIFVSCLLPRDITFKDTSRFFFNSPIIFYTSPDVQYCDSTFAKFMNVTCFIWLCRTT